MVARIDVKSSRNGANNRKIDPTSLGSFQSRGSDVQHCVTGFLTRWPNKRRFSSVGPVQSFVHLLPPHTLTFIFVVVDDFSSSGERPFWSWQLAIRETACSLPFAGPPTLPIIIEKDMIVWTGDRKVGTKMPPYYFSLFLSKHANFHVPCHSRIKLFRSIVIELCSSLSYSFTSFCLLCST